MSQVLLNYDRKTIEIEGSTSYVHVGMALADYKLDKIKVIYADKNAYANCDSCVEYFAKVNKFKLAKTMDGALITKEDEYILRKSRYDKFIYSNYLTRVKSKKF